MEWTGPILAEREYRAGSAKVIVRLGWPRREEGQDETWECRFQVVGGGDPEVQIALGVDALQALTMAFTNLRRCLDKANIVESEVAPYELEFLRPVPFAYDLEFHRRLCRMLDAEIVKKEQEIENDLRARGIIE